LERAEKELRTLEVQKLGSVAAAKEARRRKDEMGGKEDLEGMGRWWGNVDAGLRQMLEIDETPA